MKTFYNTSPFDSITFCTSQKNPFAAFECTLALIIQVDINESVTLGHFRSGHAHQVNRTPGRITHQLHTVLDCFFHLNNMLLQVVDAVSIMDRTVSLNTVDGAESVLYNKERLPVPVIQGVQRNAQAYRIDLPAPVGSFKIRVLTPPIRLPPVTSPSGPAVTVSVM